MHVLRPITELTYPSHVQMLDKDFDNTEIDDELKLGKREAETALFYHDGFGHEQ